MIYITDLYSVTDNEGIVYGAFDDSRMVGICSIDNRPVGKNKDMLNLGLLWVSKNVRKKSIGRKLISLCKEEVLKRNFTRMYISATPSKNTIDFYIRMGCELTADVDPVLYEKEPDDIHMELQCV